MAILLLLILVALGAAAVRLRGRLRSAAIQVLSGALMGLALVHLLATAGGMR